MTTRADLDHACDNLAADRLPDETGRRLIIRAAQYFMDTPSQGRDTMFRLEAIRERDGLLVELARKHCGDLRDIRPKVRRILQWALRYETSGWRRDRYATTCPAHRIGKPEGAIWEILKTWPKMPGERRLHEILSISKR